MAENKDAFEFLSKCWVPFISPKDGIYYASGNTRMRDFLRDFKVNSEMDILVLGLGDVRHVMATVAGLSQRPPSAGEVKEIRFHLNDVDQDVIARDIILLEIMNKLDPKSKSDAEFLWSVWYNAFMVEKDFARLNVVLEDLIEKYSDSSRDSERVCKFGDKQSLKSVLKTWNCWLNRKLNQSAVKRSRLKSFENAGFTMSFSDSNIAQYASMQVYIDRGIKESDVEIVGKEMIQAAIDGFVNISEDRKGGKAFVNSTLMRPGCDEWRVENGAHAAACYLPLQKEFVVGHSTIHEACFEKMRDTISAYLESRKVIKVTYTFWATDLFHLCRWLLPPDMTFDFIFTSNLMDHVGLLNLLVITQPRLKTSESILLTESHNWNVLYETLEEFFSVELRCNNMFLPSLLGLKLAEDLNLGTSSLQGFYRTMYGRHSDTESIYWTKSLNQENVKIALDESQEMFEALVILSMPTFWYKKSTNSASNIRQTPLALMYCFQRLQHLIRGGMTELLGFAEMQLKTRALDFTRNRITWNIVCWAFGLKQQRDQLHVVKIPFKDIDSRVAAMKNHCNLNYRLRLDFNNSSNKEEVLSLYQYDAIGQHFLVPILESVWNALPKDATITVIDQDGDESRSLLQALSNQKVLFKKVGKVTATYNQPKQAYVPVCNPAEFITCYEDVDKYRLQMAFGAEARASFDLLCHMLVSCSERDKGLESVTFGNMQYKFSCEIDSHEIKDDDEGHFQAILYKQKTFNTGRTALPFRLIDDSELSPFTCGQDIKRYMEETMICDLMFCSPTDIESRAKALKGQDLLTDDAFITLRVVIEQLWKIGSQKDKKLQHALQLEINDPGEYMCPEVLLLIVKGYYMYGGLPLVRLTSVELDADPDVVESYLETYMETCVETTTIYVEDQSCLELLNKMLFTNSLRMSQESPTSHCESLNTFLPMVFLRGSGEDMISALSAYPFNVPVVNNYVERIYSTSIRQNFVAPKKSSRERKKQMLDWLSSFSTKSAQFPSGKQRFDFTVAKDASSLPLKQQPSCSECKKSTTDLQKCSRCKSIAYCSKECQVKDWPKHKKSCSSAVLKTDEGSVMKTSNESVCSMKPKNIRGSSTKSMVHDCVTNEKKQKSETGNSVKADSSFKSNMQETENSDETNALADDSARPLSAELCLCCRLKKPNLKKCAKCKSAAYCSRECQLADWERHKIECQTQQLPNASPLMNRCNSCGVLGNEMKKCSQCKSASYCSIECQRTDWKNHKTTCQRP